MEMYPYTFLLLYSTVTSASHKAEGVLMVYSFTLTFVYLNIGIKTDRGPWPLNFRLGP